MIIQHQVFQFYINRSKRINLIVIILLFIVNLNAQTGERKGENMLPKYYLFAEAGISTNRPKIESLSPNVLTEVNYSSKNINKLCLHFGVGLKAKSNLVYEISLSRVAIGTDLTVGNILDSVTGGDIPIQYSKYYNVWSAQLSFGYNIKIKNFSITPLVGIGKPLNPSSEGRTEGNVTVDGKWNVNVVNDANFINTDVYSMHIKLPVGYTIKSKGKPLFEVAYSPCISFSNKNFVFDTINFSTGSSEYIFKTSNKGNYISHSISIVYIFKNRI